MVYFFIFGYCKYHHALYILVFGCFWIKNSQKITLFGYLRINYYISNIYDISML